MHPKKHRAPRPFQELSERQQRRRRGELLIEIEAALKGLNISDANFVRVRIEFKSSDIGEVLFMNGKSAEISVNRGLSSDSDMRIDFGGESRYLISSGASSEASLVLRQALRRYIVLDQLELKEKLYISDDAWRLVGQTSGTLAGKWALQMERKSLQNIAEQSFGVTATNNDLVVDVRKTLYAILSDLHQSKRRVFAPREVVLLRVSADGTSTSSPLFAVTLELPHPETPHSRNSVYILALSSRPETQCVDTLRKVCAGVERGGYLRAAGVCSARCSLRTRLFHVFGRQCSGVV